MVVRLVHDMLSGSADPIDRVEQGIKRGEEEGTRGDGAGFSSPALCPNVCGILSQYVALLCVRVMGSQ